MTTKTKKRSTRRKLTEAEFELREKLTETGVRQLLHQLSTCCPVYNSIPERERERLSGTPYWDSINLTFDRGWGLEVSVSIKPFWNDITKPGWTTSVHDMMFKVEISWSSTHRDVAAATAALALYREATDLAALAQSTSFRESFLKQLIAAETATATVQETA